ncbi:hypothetical protein VE04_08448 [Pseudogymnoascus sp. 24MN13]|nr:hypothetical protein VE04_08448 [Pseudogymnoascus sp. 24MN13]
MPEIVRTRKSRYRDDDYRGEERSYKTTVHRYRVARSPSPQSDYERPRIEVTHDTRVERVERERDSNYGRDEPARSRTLVYEREREREREQPLRPWEREQTWEREEDVRVIERSGGPGYDLVTRETEYYGRPDVAAPLVIRHKQPEPQRIIVEAPPAPQPVVIHRDREREPRREEDVYYRRHEVRDTGHPEEDYVSERKVIRRRGSGSSAEWSNEEKVVRRTTRRSRSRSHSPHHKLHLAEGAGAGAEAAALISRRRSKSASARTQARTSLLAPLSAQSVPSSPLAHTATTDTVGGHAHTPAIAARPAQSTRNLKWASVPRRSASPPSPQGNTSKTAMTPSAQRKAEGAAARAAPVAQAAHQARADTPIRRRGGRALLKPVRREQQR